MLCMRLRRKKRRRRLLLLWLLVCALLLGIYRWQTRAPSSYVATVKPFDGRVTEKNICAVTLSLRGVENESAVRLFASVCEGMDVKPCIFASNSWLQNHRELYAELSFAEWGLLLEREPSGYSRKKVMENLASENERFLSLTGSFPHFVRLTDGEPGADFSAALQSYGQICVASRCGLTETPSPGSVVDCGLLNGTTGYTLAKFCAAALAEEFNVLPLSELQGQV